ncbi:MAG: hypothetical protein ACKOC5_07655, partial [Chloroflexota bacterium]
GHAIGDPMSRDDAFDLRLAAPADDPEIRALIASVAMPGAVTMRFAREPDYFLGTTIMGDPCDVLLARRRDTGKLAAMACRAERRAYVNGQAQRLGYIGQIRVADTQRGLWLVHHGARWMRQAAPPEQLYYGVIASDNRRAARLLAGRRPPGGAQVRRVCGMTTCAILLRPRRPLRAAGVEVRPAAPAALPELVAFLQAYAPQRQFFPAYTLDDFTNGPALRGLALEDILIARRGAAVVGVMAAWDQAAYKQDIVAAYGPGLQRLRPAYDLLARLLGARPLTAPGQAIPLSFAACICIAGDDPAVMRTLLSACAGRAQRQGKAFLMVGLVDGDPLLPVARQYLHIPYHSDLVALAWSADALARLDGRMPYIEIATL